MNEIEEFLKSRQKPSVSKACYRSVPSLQFNHYPTFKLQQWQAYLKKQYFEHDGRHTSFQDFPWTERTNDRLYQFNVSTLSLLSSYLVYRDQKEDVEAENCQHLLEQFIAHSLELEKGYKLEIWNLHATALRAIELSKFGQNQSIGLPIGILDTLSEYLYLHLEVLTKFYEKRTNHGLDQSLALWILSKVFAEPTKLKLAEERLINCIECLFTEDGVLIENSPEYHIAFLHRLFQISHLIESETIQELIAPILKKGLQFAQHSLRPDGHIATIGDSEKLTVKQIINNQTIHFTSSNKFLKSFDNLTELELVSRSAGYAFMRDKWENDAVFLSFHSKALSNFHRQADDLAITLVANGQDWLIDGGLYNYAPNDSIRKYCRSAHSHNLPHITGIPVNMKSEMCENFSKILHSSIGKANVEVIASTRMQQGFEIQRKLRYNRFRKTITIFDSVRSIDNSEKQMLRTRFLIPEDKVVEKLSDHSVTARSSVSSSKMQLLSNITPTKLFIGYPKIEPSVVGIYSERKNQFKKAFVVDFYYPFIKNINIATEIALID